MKSKEELNAIKAEVEALGGKLAELSEDELLQISGGLHNMPEKKDDEKYVMSFSAPEGPGQYEFHFYKLDPKKLFREE